ncbi:MAG: hypothetical protein PHF37_02220 [Phycisphaerae bacterium]|nr:hypothetical protein [Phycisphaerae bacterium]
MKLFNYNKLNCIWVSVFTVTIVSFHVFAINSKIVKHSNADELSNGTTENTIIDSRGTIRLGRAATVLVEDFDNAWSINDIVQIENDIYLGTSPNGGIYKYSGGKLQKIYPLSDEQRAEPAEDVNDPNTGKIVKRSETIENEHIFAMAADSKDRLLAAVSGKTCRLMRFDGEQMETIFEPNDTIYIFDIAVVDKSIFVATGPSGIVYRIDADGAVKVYQTEEKNVLSLAAGEKGTLYAGTDTRGLVYKIDTNTGQLTVVYDSEQPEITALVYEQGKLYAAGTRAEIKEVETNFAAS